MTSDMISKVKNYQKQPTPFLSWSDLPPLQNGYTDLYFFGQPGSGKSCILASIFFYLEQQAMIINNSYNQQGNIYRALLKDEISYGILPDSTAVEGVNYIPFELINHENKGNRHPLNFVEMSGELFNKAYEGGINADSLAARDYLNNSNRKLIYFVLDYDQHEKSKMISSGPSQSSKMQTILALLDDFGTLKYTDGIYIVVTKTDLFPEGVDRYQYAKQFLEGSYNSFLVNCKVLQEKYRNNFDITVYPYSIGQVKFQNMLVQFDLRSPKELIEDILEETFVTKKSFFGKLF
jgi:GTPase SAR1 family protein